MGERKQASDGERSIWLNDWMPVLGPLGVGLGAMVLIFVIKTGALLYALIDGVDPGADDAVDAIRGVGWLFGAAVGGVVAVVFGTWRAVIAGRQTAVARDQYERSLDRDYADLFTKAVEQLGTDKVVKRPAKDALGEIIFDENGRAVMEEVTEPNIEVRLGAIYALERISQDSERDHIAVMETLCAYVRENTSISNHIKFSIWIKNTSLEQTPLRELRSIWLEEQPKPRADIQAIITAIGRRSEKRISYEIRSDNNSLRYRVDLRQCVLVKAHLRNGNFSNALFSESSLDGIDAREANLEGAYFLAAQLNKAKFQKSKMKQTGFVRASLTDVSFAEIELNKTTKMLKNEKSTVFPETPIEAINLREAILDGSAFLTSDIKNINFYLSNLSGANLRGSLNMKKAVLNRSFGCAGTMLPKKIKPPKHWHPKN